MNDTISTFDLQDMLNSIGPLTLGGQDVGGFNLFSSPSNLLDTSQFGLGPFGTTIGGPFDVGGNFTPNLSTEDPNLGVGTSLPQSGAPGGDNEFLANLWDKVMANPLTAASLGLAGLTALFGVGSVVQALVRGDPKTKSVISQALSTASPEERAAFQTAVQSGTQVSNVLGQRQPLESELFRTGAENLMSLGNQFQTSIGNLPQASPEVANALQKQSLAMAQGQLPNLDPGLMSLVDQIFGGADASLGGFLDTSLRSAIERANQMGFPTSPDILRESPTSALMAPALQELLRQKQILEANKANVKLNLAQSLPGSAAQLEANRLAPGIATSVNAQNAFRAGGTLAGTELGVGNSGVQNLISLIQALTGTGGQLLNTRNRNTNQTTSQNTGGFTQALGPLGSLLGGVGGALGGLSQAALWDKLLGGSNT